MVQGLHGSKAAKATEPATANALPNSSRTAYDVRTANMNIIYDEISTGTEKIPSLLPMVYPDRTGILIEFGAKHQKATTVKISMEAAVVLIAELSAHVRDHLLPKS